MTNESLAPARRTVPTALVATVGAIIAVATMMFVLTPTADAARIQPRIVGGSTVGAGAYTSDWGFIVALVDPVARNARSGQFCAGSLISPTRVVTAAHCVTDSWDGTPVSASSFNVLVGRRTLSDTGSGTSIKVAAVLVNPLYDPMLNTNDIAVLRLAAPATGTPTIDFVHTGQEALWGNGGGLAYNPLTGPFVAGWGALGENASLPDSLRSVGVPIHADSVCADGGVGDGLGLGSDFDPASMICAGTLDTSDPSVGALNNASDSCYGDSGGPLIVSDGGGGFLLAGIVSFGLMCGDRQSYGVYTRVGAFADWIAGDPPLLPVNTARPVVTGTPALGRTLSCSPGTWTSTAQPLTYTYQWATSDRMEGVQGPGYNTWPIANATGSKYTLTKYEVGSGIVCVVTATSSAGSTSRSSNVTSEVSGPPNFDDGEEDGDGPAFTLRRTSKTCSARSCRIGVKVTNQLGTRVVALDGVATSSRLIRHLVGTPDSAVNRWVFTVPRTRVRQRFYVTGTDRIGMASSSIRMHIPPRPRRSAKAAAHHRSSAIRHHARSVATVRQATATTAARSLVGQTRIINGSSVDAPTFAAKWSWTASLQYVPDRAHVPSATSGHICTGSLITPTRVLLAAHCVVAFTDVMPAKTFDVIVGRRDLRATDGERRTVSHIYVDPQYNANELGDHDAAIVEFATPIPATITPVGIVQPGDTAAWGNGAGVPVGVDGPWIAGWGARRTLGGWFPVSLPTTLTEGAVPIVADSECADGGAAGGLGWGRLFDPATMLCAGALDTSDPALQAPNGTTVCNGDSGGPLIVKDGGGNWKVAGITSFGSVGCGTRENSAVFTRVDGERSWIEQAVQVDPVRYVEPMDDYIMVSGDPVEQGTLTCDRGTFTGSGVTFSTVWYRAPSADDQLAKLLAEFRVFGFDFSRHTTRAFTSDQLIALLGVERIAGATGHTYSPTRADVGRELGCITVATNPGWTTFSIPELTGAVAIAGYHGDARNARLTVQRNRCTKEGCLVVIRVRGRGVKSITRIGGWKIGSQGGSTDVAAMPNPVRPGVWLIELPPKRAEAQLVLLGWDDLGRRTKVFSTVLGRR